MNCALRCVDWKVGDKILVNSSTYPAVYQTCRYITNTRGIMNMDTKTMYLGNAIIYVFVMKHMLIIIVRYVIMICYLGCWSTRFYWVTFMNTGVIVGLHLPVKLNKPYLDMDVTINAATSIHTRGIVASNLYTHVL